mmetsp:Transcript_13632/g.29533  ORF Transcript_13632/g.29533 Transcript_13632/m.29533 type:complete len:163 (+) Transcript_13632:81-569(+)
MIRTRMMMIDILILVYQKIKSNPRRPAGKRRRKSIDGSEEKSLTSTTSREENAAEDRRQYLFNQIIEISNESYDRGMAFLSANKFDDARECFEAALAARLVLYGPESACVLEVHEKLTRVAYVQGDANKEAHHRLKVSQIQSLLRVNGPYANDRVDWSVLCK